MNSMQRETHHVRAFQQSKSRTIVNGNVIQSSNFQSSNFPTDNINSSIDLDDLNNLNARSCSTEIDNVIKKYSKHLDELVHHLNRGFVIEPRAIQVLKSIHDILHKSWSIPEHGYKIGTELCKALKVSDGLDIILRMTSEFSSTASPVLEQCLTNDNVSYLARNGLGKIVKVATSCVQNGEVETGTGILEHLLKHSEASCLEVIRFGGIDALIIGCQKDNVIALRHCAGAFINLALFGGSRAIEIMTKQNVLNWLFYLAFHDDVKTNYLACLTITILVSDKIDVTKKIEMECMKMVEKLLTTLEPYLLSQKPRDFLMNKLEMFHGQSKEWLQQLVPYLSSKNETSRNLVAFQFYVEADIRKYHNCNGILKDINVIEPLKKVANTFDDNFASKYATKTLILIGECLPHKLPPQVIHWTKEDVREWIKQIGLTEHAAKFSITGESLLKLKEMNLRDDFDIHSPDLRKRFQQELQKFKKECNIYKPPKTISVGTQKKTMHAFISYRRSTGKHLASLLKVYLTNRKFSVFLDVDRLRAGPFDTSLIHYVKSSKYFLLVLTSDALDRCNNDSDWVRKEIVAAMDSGCIIIPVLDNFEWPNPEDLPEDIRSLQRFNGVHWNHDYQEASIKKIAEYVLHFLYHLLCMLFLCCILISVS